MYHYDVEGRLIAESNQKGEVLKECLWLDGELIAAAEGGGLYFAHRDYRNQPCLVTDKDGAAVWKAVSSPFGATRVLSPFRSDFGKIAETPNQNIETIGSFTLNLRLPGQYFDAETGYHYNGLRDYSPELGRYLQADPIGLNGGMNLYAYCGGDPVNKADPMGLADPGADIGNGQVDETESIDDGCGDDDYQESIDVVVELADNPGKLANELLEIKIEQNGGFPPGFDKKAFMEKWGEMGPLEKLKTITDYGAIDFKTKYGSRFEKKGNDFFGYLAAMGGIPLGVAKLGGGLYQLTRDLKNHGFPQHGPDSNFDDPADQKAIEKEWNDYVDEYGHWTIDGDPVDPWGMFNN